MNDYMEYLERLKRATGKSVDELERLKLTQLIKEYYEEKDNERLRNL